MLDSGGAAPSLESICVNMLLRLVRIMCQRAPRLIVWSATVFGARIRSGSVMGAFE